MGMENRVEDVEPPYKVFLSLGFMLALITWLVLSGVPSRAIITNYFEDHYLSEAITARYSQELNARDFEGVVFVRRDPSCQYSRYYATPCGLLPDAVACTACGQTLRFDIDFLSAGAADIRITRKGDEWVVRLPEGFLQKPDVTRQRIENYLTAALDLLLTPNGQN